MPHRLRLALVILAAAAVYLIGNDRVPLWDRDEPRNAQAARQMYLSGDWVVPRFLDKVRTAKPVFTYWCQAIAMHALGDNTFAARLPSAVAMTLTLIVLAGVLSRHTDPERAFWTVFILATSAIVIAWSAKTSLTDAVLLLWIVIAHACAFAVLQGNRTWRVVITLSIAIGLAGLTKGPVVLGVMGMTLLMWLALFWWLGRPARALAATAEAEQERLTAANARARRPSHGWFELWLPRDVVTLKILFGAMIIAAIVGPWLYLVEHRAPGFILTTASHDVFRRVFEPLEQHKGPFGYYLLMLWGIYFPWSVLLPLTFVVAWRHRDDARVRFALAATIGPWLMLECVQTKLPHYLLPIFPPLAFLTADAIVRCLKGEHDDLATRGTRGAIAAWSAIVLAMIVALIVLLPKEKGLATQPGIVFVPAIIAAAYALIVWWFFHQRRPRTGLIAMGVGFMLVMGTTFGILLPRVPALRLSIQIADILQQNGGSASETQPGDVQMIAYKEPSLAFYQGGTIREQSENDFLVNHPPSDWPRFLVIREDVWKRMPPAIQQQLEVLGSATGIDLPDRGRTWTVYVLRKR